MWPLSKLITGNLFYYYEKEEFCIFVKQLFLIELEGSAHYWGLLLDATEGWWPLATWKVPSGPHI